MRPRPRIREAFRWGGLALCAASCVVWAASWVWGGAWDVARGYSVFVDRGEFGVGWSPRPGGVPAEFRRDYGSVWAPLSWRTESMSPPGWWFRAASFSNPAAVGAVGWLVAWRLEARARRAAAGGRCPACGYDRAGLPASTPPPPCPECGAAGR